jgi:hypothetical protein
MRSADSPSWSVTVEHRPLLACCALWIRAAEQLVTPADPFVPAALDLDLPPPLVARNTDELAAQWVHWWYSIVGPPNQVATGSSEPAHGTIDPLGLAGRPALAELVARRGSEAVAWHASGSPEEQSPLDVAGLVAEAEAALGRPAAIFDLHLTLLPVAEDDVREVVPGRHYLVPERFYGSARFHPWLHGIIEQLA